MFEGTALYMPTALPGISVGQATQLIRNKTASFDHFQESASVLGSIGQSESATGDVPPAMDDTIVTLKPREQLWC